MNKSRKDKIEKIEKDVEDEIYLQTEGESGITDYVNITQLVDKINEIIDKLNNL